MSTWLVRVDAETTTLSCDDYQHVAPLGAVQISTELLLADPPRPEELTNAIGAVVDQLDDVVREREDALGADLAVTGAEVEAIAAVEVGGAPTLPMVLSRDAAEDVFRTLATEGTADRRHNPGLPPALVGTVVGACCILVALMRRLHLDAVTVVARER